MWCVCVNICMNDRALRAVKKLYIRLCAARDSNAEAFFFFAGSPHLGILGTPKALIADPVF